jgi:hypothetical protein
MPTLFLTKAPKTYHREKTASSTNVSGKTGYLHTDRSMSFTCTDTNSKLIKDLNIKLEILKLVQERIGNILELVGIGNDFLNSIPIISA